MDFRGAAQERAGLKPPLPHPFLLVALGHHQRGRKAGGGGQSPAASPRKFLVGYLSVILTAGGGHAPGGWGPRRAGATSPRGHRPQSWCWGESNCPRPQVAPNPWGCPPHTPPPCFPCNNPAGRVRSRWGRGPGGDVLHRITGLKTAPEGTPHPTPLGIDRSRGPKSGGGAAGFQANGGLGERRPSEGHAALSPSCRTQAGEKGGRGGPARHGCAPQLAHFPI